MSPRSQGRGDEGVALVVAVALVGLVTTAVLVMLAYAMSETGFSGRDRQRASAVAAAEGQLDLTLARIQNASVASLPCGTLPVVSSKQSSADTIDITTTVKYFDAAGAEVACAGLASGLVSQAKIVSAGLSNSLGGRPRAKRTVESLVQLTPKLSNLLDKAIFGSGGVSLDNSFEILGNGGVPNANIYSNKDITCRNSGKTHGSIASLGRIDLQNSCTVDVDVHATTGFHADNSVKVGGSVLVSSGNATFNNSVTVGQQVRTSGTITWDSCTPSKCVPGSSVPPVTATPFPVLNWNAAAEAAWRAAGYNNVVYKNDCANENSTNNPAKWIKDNAPLVATGKAIVVTDCKVLYRNSNTVALAADLVVYARGGFEFRNSLTFKSVDSTVRSLHLIHPYDAASATPCTTTNIQIGNSAKVEATVSEFLYTPCNIVKENSGDYFGQIYAGGTAQFKNSFKMQFRPVPTFGLSGVGGSTAESYSLAMVYKRETG